MYFNLFLSVCACSCCAVSFAVSIMLIIFRRVFAMLSSLSVFSVADAICIVLFVLAAALVVEFFSDSFSD